MMTKAFNQFSTNIDGLNNLTVVYDAFVEKINPLDISDILRAQIVLAVSALDSYIHDVCEDAMLYIFENKDFSNNNSFKNFPVTLEILHQIVNSKTNEDKILYLTKEIKKNNGFKSFQEPDKIAGALSHLGIKSIWVKIGVELNEQSTNLQNRLSLIVQRRNQIAHESDINPSLGIGEKYGIDRSMVQSIIEFIKQIVTCIDKIIDDEKIFKPQT